MSVLRLIQLIMWLVFSATSVSAQQSVSIRAGEHPTYSRLVIPTANALAWELRTTGRTATLILPTNDISFLTDQIFDRIPRTRLLDVDRDEDGDSTVLSLRLACDCEVVASVEGNSLILDVRSPETSDPDTVQETIGAAAPTPRPSQDDRKEDVAETEAPVEGTDLAARLLSQLNKAAEQGLIELNETNDASPEESQEPAPPAEPMVEPSSTDEPANLDPTEVTLDGLEAVGERLEDRLAESLEQAGLDDSVRVTIPEELIVPDRPDQPSRRRPDEPEADTAEINPFCVDDEFLDVAYWADARPYSEQVTQLQAQVFGEFDKPDLEATLHLARFYIFFGLGTEAKALLDDLGTDEQQTSLLREVASTVEGNAYKPGGALDKAAGCEGAISLWRTAAIDTGETQPIANEDEVIDIFSEYPIEVRRIIGPRLIQSFLTRGQNSAASRIFAIVERAAGYHGDQHELRRADLLLKDGRVQDAEDKYWALVHTNSVVTAEAATALVDSILNRNALVPDNVVSVIEALAFEYRGSETGTELLLSAINARAGSKDISAALSIAIDEIAANPEEAQSYYNAINSFIPSASPDQMGAFDYTQFVYTHLELFSGPDITNDNKFDISKKLLEIGLPNAALRMANSVDGTSEGPVRTLIANASLKMGARSDVLRLWNEDRSNEELTSLASQALSSLGRHEEALASAPQNDPSVLNKLAWHAGAWDRSARSSELLVQVLSQYMLDRERPREDGDEFDPGSVEEAVGTAIEEEGDVTLRYAKSVKAQSQTIRTFLSDALDQM